MRHLTILFALLMLAAPTSAATVKVIEPELTATADRALMAHEAAKEKAYEVYITAVRKSRDAAAKTLEREKTKMARKGDLKLAAKIDIELDTLFGTLVGGDIFGDIPAKVAITAAGTDFEVKPLAAKTPLLSGRTGVVPTSVSLDPDEWKFTQGRSSSWTVTVLEEGYVYVACENIPGTPMADWTKDSDVLTSPGVNHVFKRVFRKGDTFEVAHNNPGSKGMWSVVIAGEITDARKK